MASACSLVLRTAHLTTCLTRPRSRRPAQLPLLRVPETLGGLVALGVQNETRRDFCPISSFSSQRSPLSRPISLITPVKRNVSPCKVYILLSDPAEDLLFFFFAIPTCSQLGTAKVTQAATLCRVIVLTLCVMLQRRVRHFYRTVEMSVFVVNAPCLCGFPLPVISARARTQTRQRRRQH